MSKSKNPTHYRNKEDFCINELESVDAGSLWTLVGNKLVLVDDDSFVQTDLDLNLFEKV
jgi:Ni/Co efflux regulator RcnB